MLQMLAVRAGEVLTVVTVAAAVLVAVTAAGVWWMRRWLRRRLAARQVVVGRARGVAAGAAAAGGRWLWSRPLPDRRWVAAARARRGLWRSVSSAEYAVAQARRAGAPSGDLEGLCRRLRRAATDADRRLVVQGRPPGPGRPDPVPAEVAELIRTAGLIRDCAVAATGLMSGPAVAALAQEARKEAVALSAGLASVAGGSRAPGWASEAP